jgi:hypothetical protein
MAFSTVVTKIANPARRKSVAKHYTAKQIKAGFGGKRRKNAARHRRPAKKRASAHRKRTSPRPRLMKSWAQNPPRKRAKARKRSSPKAKARRRNPVPQIIAWTAGNPAKRRNGMKRKRRATARKSNAGTRHYRRRRKNPSRCITAADGIQGRSGRQWIGCWAALA